MANPRRGVRPGPESGARARQWVGIGGSAARPAPGRSAAGPGRAAWAGCREPSERLGCRTSRANRARARFRGPRDRRRPRRPRADPLRSDGNAGVCPLAARALPGLWRPGDEARPLPGSRREAAAGFAQGPGHGSGGCRLPGPGARGRWQEGADAVNRSAGLAGSRARPPGRASGRQRCGPRCWRSRRGRRGAGRRGTARAAKRPAVGAVGRARIRERPERRASPRRGAAPRQRLPQARRPAVRVAWA